MKKLSQFALQAISLTSFLVLWQLVIVAGIIPNYLVPTPVQVVFALVKDFQLLMTHTGITLLESLVGLAIGVLIGFALAVLMDFFKTLDKLLSPLVTISQTIPIVTIAPLLVLWLGYGLLPKIVLVAISTFFPITVALNSAFKAIDPDMFDLMTTMGASRVQIFWHVKLAAAAPQFFSGRVRKAFAYDRMFAAIVVVSALSLVLMKLVELVQKRALPWDTSQDAKESAR
ncbi:MAG: ABC transporter permease [Atopobium sp.]|nr:ABC transporter permease [Atopobium sp.]